MKPFEPSTLPDGCEITCGRVPENLVSGEPDGPDFQRLWEMHPTTYTEAMIHGRRVNMPRWIQAYEKDYPYSNQTAVALAAPPEIKHFLDWSIAEIDPRHNGILINWHDGKEGHYHGKHRDSEKGLIPGTRIITISLGEERVFRLRPHRSPAGVMHDVILKHGDFIVIPWETNRRWTHEIPRLARYQGRRISVTIRAFL